MNRLLRDIGLLAGLALAVACARLPHEGASGFRPSPGLSAIDSLMWRQPDSAFAQLLRFADTAEADSLDAFDRNYFQLLVAELLYKNDYAQSNRPELKQAVAYYDSLNSTLADNSSSPFPHRRSLFPHCGPDPQSPDLYDLIPFLSARAHYINGVGYYENDSAVEACAEYLKALEVMEDRFEEKELVGKRAQFMALAYTHLADLFSRLYLHEQAIYFGKLSLEYYQKYDPEPWHIAWALNNIGSQYQILENIDSASYYYERALSVLPEPNGLMYRDIITHLVFFSYEKGEPSESALDSLRHLCILSESDREYYSRCLTIGEVFFLEAQFDSAWLYFDKVFEHTQNIGSKKMAAGRLLEICKENGDDSIIPKYTGYLAKFATFMESNGTLNSTLVELYRQYNQNKVNRLREKNTRRNVTRIGWIIGCIVTVTCLSIVANIIIRRRNKTLKADNYAQKMKQAALAGKLKKSNEALRDAITQMKNSRLEKTPPPTNNLSDYSAFLEEPVCRHILAVCNDKNNPIKSTVPVSAYAGIALTYAQKAELKEAALRHYGHLFERLRQQYPELKEKDFFYCYLCLLELDNVQISALMQKTISTIWDRESRLKRIFGSEDKVSVVLHGLMNN